MNELDWVIERSKRIHGVCTFHLNNQFAEYCDLFCGGYNHNFEKAQKRLRRICNKLEKKNVLFSEWGGTGPGGVFDFGVNRYKGWYHVDNKWNKKR